LVIVGPGALGILLAVRLWEPVTAHGHRLLLVDHREDRAGMLNASGLSLEESGRILSARPPVLLPSSHPDPVDLVLFCVKSIDLARSLDQCDRLIGPDTLVVGIQNGMDHVSLLRGCRGIPAAAVCSEGADLPAPGRARHNGRGKTLVGLLNDDQRGWRRLQILAALLCSAGLDAEARPDIAVPLWRKLIVNAAINPLTAIHDRKNGQLLTSCSVRSTMKKVVAEAVAVARAHGIDPGDDSLDLVFTTCRKTRNNTSSMLQDLRRGRPTEISAINGFLVREGKALGIPTPKNREMVERIRALEQATQESGP